MKGVINYKQRITEQATNVGCKSGYIIINKKSFNKTAISLLPNGASFIKSCIPSVCAECTNEIDNIISAAYCRFKTKD